jgi:hypothetical protein
MEVTCSLLEAPVRKYLPLLVTVTAGLAVLTVSSPAAAEVANPRPGTALLITGDVVTVRPAPDGRPAANITPATEKGLARALVHLTIAGKAYEVPATALPYLGRGLDPSLFDVQAVLKAQKNGRVPVKLSSDGAQPAVPGVQATTAGDGYLDLASAKEFGAALAQQFAEDRASGSYGGKGLFAAKTSIALEGAEPARVKPASVMRTVTVNANNAEGRPDEGGTALLYNVDNGDLLDFDESTNYFFGGTAKFSVPEGRYSALGLFFSTDAENNVTGVRFSAQPEFTVAADITIRLDAQRATSKVTWVTPRPALPAGGGFFIRRAATAGSGFTVDVDAGSGVPVWVSPTSKPVKVGQLQSYPYSRLISAPGPGTPYEYQLQKAASGIIPQQRYVVAANSLATVNASYFSELGLIGQRQRAGAYPFELEGTARLSHPMEMPRKQTEYVSADPSIMWFGGIAKYVDSEFGGWRGGQYEAGRGYQPGTTLTEDWNKFPLHPAGNVSLLAQTDPRNLTVPAATRNGDQVKLELVPFSDSQPGHTGFGFLGEQVDSVYGGYVVEENGIKIAESTGPMIDVVPEFTLSPEPSTVRLVVDANRYGPMYRLSNGSNTEWTWKSQHVQGAQLPDAFVCRINRGEPLDRVCAVEPLLTLAYGVGGMSLSGLVKSGQQTLDVTVGHLRQSAASKVTAVAVQFSLDEGGTWQDATTTEQGDGVYRAAYTATAPTFRGVPVSLRVTATDESGGRIVETTTGAYKIFD